MKFLAPDDLVVGMRVTVIKNNSFQNALQTQSSVLSGDEWKGESEQVKTVEDTDRSGYGDVLTILAINLPYVAVRHESPYALSRFNYAIDIRRTVLSQLSDDYAKSLCPYLFS